jgi:hypothetical protein
MNPTAGEPKAEITVCKKNRKRHYEQPALHLHGQQRPTTKRLRLKKAHLSKEKA